jgi:ABC-type transport system substrate-binding protein
LKPEQLGAAASYYTYDLALAKRLVAETGVGDQLRKFGYVQNFYGYDKMAEAVNGMLNQAGFKTQLVPLDYQKDYTNGGKGVWFGNFPTDMIVLGVTGGPPTAESYLGSFVQPGNSFNPAKVDDAAAKKIVALRKARRDLANGVIFASLSTKEKNTIDALLEVATERNTP